jgi:hypothetical protein
MSKIQMPKNFFYVFAYERVTKNQIWLSIAVCFKSNSVKVADYKN